MHSIVDWLLVVLCSDAILLHDLHVKCVRHTPACRVLPIPDSASDCPSISPFLTRIVHDFNFICIK